MYFQSATGPLNFCFNPSARELRGIMSNRSSFKSENTSNTGLSVLTEADDREGKYSFELGTSRILCYGIVLYCAIWCGMVWYNVTSLIISHHIISHHITSHHITSYQIISHHITSHHITSHHITLHNITSYHITSHNIISQITSYHITSRHITSYHITWTWHDISGHYITCRGVPLYDRTILQCRIWTSTHSSDTTISSLQSYLIIPYYSFIQRDYR